MSLAASSTGSGPRSASGRQLSKRPRAIAERTVLVVEDDAALANTTAAILRAVGWLVDLAPDGESAIRAVGEHRYDVLLLDLKMPGMGGLAALRSIRSLPNPPDVLVMSGHLDTSSVSAALRAGAAEILEKPVDLRQLVGLLDGYSQTHSDFSRVDGTDGLNGTEGQPKDALRTALDPAVAVPEILGNSPAIRLVREQIVNVSRFKDMAVLIIGETGTGKELVAQAIHRLSGRAGGLHELNCAAVPEELFESEVFGHEAGSFTGAKTPRVGLFEGAGRGTVFLDEVGEMPALLQAKLLRVLESRTFRRLGSNRMLELQARIVSATNRPLRGRDGDALRTDLFFRLAGYTIRTPPLRDRMEDIEVLARSLLSQFARDYPTASRAFSPRAIDALHAHHWPGNVRELRSVIHYAAARAHGEIVGVREVVEALRAHGFGEDTPEKHAAPPLPPPAPAAAAARTPTGNLRDMERDAITQAFAETGGNLSAAAQRLGIPRTTLRDKLKRLGLR